MDIVHNPPNKKGLRIDEVFVFVSVDDDGDEGVCAFFDAYQGMMMPMVAADKARLEQLRIVAQKLATQREWTGKSIKLIRLCSREELETITAAN